MTAAWLRAAIDYAGSWLEHQVRVSEMPGAAMAVRHGGAVVETAIGAADLSTAEEMTTRHRFRMASLSKTVTAMGIMKLVEMDALELSAPVGRYLRDLHPTVAAATVEQVLSHTAGISRDGDNSGYFADVSPFPRRHQVLGQLAVPTVLDPGTRVKYSNHGYALLGLVIEAVTHQTYRDWIATEIIKPLGLSETTIDPVLPVGGVPFARGHSAKLPLGRRVVIPAANVTNAFAPVAGVVSTAGDMSRLYASLSAQSEAQLLSAESRRMMTTLVAPDVDSTADRRYGLGVQRGSMLGWEWFGHTGLFQGSAARAVAVPQIDVTVVVAVNALDGPAEQWTDGVVHIVRRFHDGGSPSGWATDWTGRWWTMWGATDLVAVGDHVIAVDPAAHPPFLGSSVIGLDQPDHGTIVAAPVMHRLGEPASRRRNGAGDVVSVSIGGVRLVPEPIVSAHLRARYEPDPLPEDGV